MQLIAILSRLSIALWVGGASLFTFILTPIIFKSFPRDQAGVIVGHLFPAYFRWGLAWGTLALISRLFLKGKEGGGATVILVIMLCLTSFQAFYIEPRAVALKKEIASFESTPKDHPARKAFGKLHGISALCNLTVIVGGIALVVLP
jgi:Domain of unknown function (DUF4149)